MATHTEDCSSSKEPAPERGLSMMRSIGAGSCGTVFEYSSNEVLKYSVPTTALAENAQLWNDWVQHRAVSKALDYVERRVGQIKVQVPQFLSFVPENSRLWRSHARGLPEGYRKPANLLLSQRIPPVPQSVREIIIKKWCPTHLKESAKLDPANKDALIRILLGKRRAARRMPLQMFSLRNFGFTLDHTEEIRLDATKLARRMARLLAGLHWIARIDAGDIEIVLGGSQLESEDNLHSTSKQMEPVIPGTEIIKARTKHRSEGMRLFVLDFNQCQSMTMDAAGIAQAVKRFFANDPYFPRPPIAAYAQGELEEELWTTFETKYIDYSSRLIDEMMSDPAKEADKLPDEAKGFPFLFIQLIKDEWQTRLEKMVAAEERSGDEPPPA